MLETLSNLINQIPAWVYITLVVHFTVLGTVAYLILLERKTASWVQDRIGPNRVGLGLGIIPGIKNFHFWGLGQPLADGLKFIVKEDYRAAGIDKVLFTLAPIIMIIVVIISIAVIPWGGVIETTKTFDVAPVMQDNSTLSPEQALAKRLPAGVHLVSPVKWDGQKASVTYRWDFQVARLNIGVLFVLATLSLAVYGVVIGGWASNNKYSFLGGLRATANMISYEIPLGLSVLAIVVLFGTLDLGDIVRAQIGYWWGWLPMWNVFVHPLAFLMFLICIHAEANRAPFDMAEAEQELVGGYHTEYSSMRFALFFLAEYAGMITTSAVCVALFFGGWHLPGLSRFAGWITGGSTASTVGADPAVTTSLIEALLRSGIFFGKTVAVLFVFMWVRWSLPRFRFDQVMSIAWRGLIPISLALMLASAFTVWGWTQFGGGPRDVNDPSNLLRLPEGMAATLLIVNVVMLVLIFIVSALMPAAPNTNRRLKVQGSRYAKTPLSPAVAPTAL